MEDFYLTWFITCYYLGESIILLSPLLCLSSELIFRNFFSLGRQLQFQPNICLGEGLARIIERKRNIQLSDLSKARKIEFLWLLWLPANDLHNSLLSVWRCRGKTLSPHPHPEQFIHLGRDEHTVRLIQERQHYFSRSSIEYWSNLVEMLWLDYMRRLFWW